MKGLFFDIYRAILPFLNPYTLSKLRFLNRKQHRLVVMTAILDARRRIKYSSYYNLLSPLFFFLHKYKDDRQNNLNYAAVYAAKAGRIGLCHFFIKNGAKHIYSAFIYAAKYGHIDLCFDLERLYNIEDTEGFFSIDLALSAAAYGGHINVCHRLILNYGANDVNTALISAAKGSHIDLCNIFIHLYGARDLDTSIFYAKNRETKNFLENERAALL